MYVCVNGFCRIGFCRTVFYGGHCKRYRATGPHRAGVDVDVTPPTGVPVGHPLNPATLCDRSAQGSKS